MVNVAIAAGAAAAVALWSPPAAAVVGLVSLGLIYLRGYLIPGTPALTKRYLPAWMLARFGKAPPGVDTDGGDPGSVLLEAGLLELTPDDSDLQLDREFTAAWARRTQELLAETPDDQVLLASFLEVSPSDLLVADSTSGLSAYHSGELLGSWESRTAFLADMAGVELLAPLVPDWGDRSAAGRSELASTLRLFTDTCPRCDSAVELEEDVRSTCCSDYDVITGACTVCGTHLLELPVSEAMRDAMDE